MATIDDFTTPEDGWALVNHFLSNRLPPIRAVSQAKPKDWLDVISQDKQDLYEEILKIAQRMEAIGHTADSLKIAEIAKMIQDGDLTVSANIDAIFAKNQEFNQGTRDMKAKLKELFPR
jgi:hypothetical protein